MTAVKEGAVRPGPVAGLLVAVIGAYQRWVSPFLGDRCRFFPSCSTYAKTAIELHGARRGSWLAIRRLLKCQPFHPGGFDYVPPRGPALDHRRPEYGETMSAGPAKRGSS